MVDANAAAKRPAPRGNKWSRRRRAMGLAVEPVFCPADVADPFDTVAVGTPHRRHQGRRAARCCSSRPTAKSPPSWSQLATNVVVSKYFYGEIDTPEREHSVRQLIHRVTPHDRRLGHRRTATSPRAEDGERFYRELTWLCLHQHGAFNSPVWFNVGLYPPVRREGRAVQLALGRRDRHGHAAGEPVRISARLGLLHPERRRQHGRHHGARPQRGHAVQVRLGHRHRPVDAPLAPREALRRRQALAARCRSCGSTTRSPPW